MPGELSSPDSSGWLGSITHMYGKLAAPRGISCEARMLSENLSVTCSCRSDVCLPTDSAAMLLAPQSFWCNHLSQACIGKQAQHACAPLAVGVPSTVSMV